MFVKIAAIALTAFITISKGDDVWTGFTAKWSVNTLDGYYTLPQTLDDAVTEGWTEISGVVTSDNETALGYYDDPLVVLLFSTDTGEIIGTQVSLRKTDIEERSVPVDYSANPAMILKTLNGQEYYTATAYLNLDNREIWIQEQDGLVEIPTSAQLAQETRSYIKNPCVQWMGVHYYRINTTTTCSELYPWLLVAIDDNIIGFGFLAVGNSTVGSNRTWFETLPDPVPNSILGTIPYAPTCLTEGAVEYGYSLFHIWFIDNPLDIMCYDNKTVARLESTTA